jgi:diguanylate cyclase (GGDEF)-like protein
MSIAHHYRANMSGSTATPRDNGVGIFDQTVKNMVQALRADAGYLARLVPGSPGAVQTVAAIADQTFLDEVSFDVERTPCSALMTASEIVTPENATALYPKDPIVSLIGASSCLGHTLLDSAGAPIGMLVVLYRTPLRQTLFSAAKLEFFAGRASAELEHAGVAARAAHALTPRKPIVLGEEIPNTLTALPDRQRMILHLKQLLEPAQRSAMHALLLVDLDHFRTLNDVHGLDAGDFMIQLVAMRLSGCLRERDIVIHLDGDRFAVIIDDLNTSTHTAGAQAKIVAEKIMATLRQPFQLGEHRYLSTASIGVTLFGGRKDTPQEVIGRAEAALYGAKAEGRDGVRFHDPELHALLTARATMESELRDALNRDEMVLYYQPQMNAEGRIIGAEALVRWRHPRLGLLMPGDFITLAEDTGLILPLGRWVLEAACEQLATWSTHEDSAHLAVSVNVSGRQIRHPEFVGQVLAILCRCGTNLSSLKLELTESVLMDETEHVIRNMDALKSIGVSFSLDDFGTGYSSLSYLNRLPLDELKIDRSFVRDILTDAHSAIIARTIVGLAHNLGLSVIAEGVESAEQRDLLAEYGCHSYQGYFLSPPLPAEQFEQLLLKSLGSTRRLPPD